MQRHRILAMAISLVVMMAIAGSAFAVTPNLTSKPSNSDAVPKMPKPTVGKPSSPKPTQGRPSAAAPDTTSLASESSDKNRPPMPTGSEPSLPKPVGSQPTTSAPTGGDPHGDRPDSAPRGSAADYVMPGPKPNALPGPDKPNRIEPATRPDGGTPSQPKPSGANPGPKPDKPVPQGNPPSGSAPNSPAPARVTNIDGQLNTLTQEQLGELVSRGYPLTEVLQADRAAAKGIGTVSQIFAWRAQGQSWSAILQLQSKTAPQAGLNAAQLRNLLVDPANAEIHALMDALAAQTGLSADTLLTLMGEQYSLNDLHNAASIATASGQNLSDVLALKTASNTWEQIAHELKH